MVNRYGKVNGCDKMNGFDGVNWYDVMIRDDWVHCHDKVNGYDIKLSSESKYLNILGKYSYHFRSANPKQIWM